MRRQTGRASQDQHLNSAHPVLILLQEVLALRHVHTPVPAVAAAVQAEAAPAEAAEVVPAVEEEDGN